MNSKLKYIRILPNIDGSGQRDLKPLLVDANLEIDHLNDQQGFLKFIAQKNLK